jgi:bifunctional DNase/RNase
MELLGVRVEVPANTPMMLLQEQDGDRRLLPIYIGHPEASSIHTAIEGIEPPRPLTHDLFIAVLDRLGHQLTRVVITEVRDHTYYADLHVRSGTDDSEIVVSSRPSDAIALAVRRDVPIFAATSLLDEVGQTPVVEPEEQAEEIIDEFKDFIESVNPEDFAS